MFTKSSMITDKPCDEKSSRAICRMAYLQAQVTRCMLSYSIAIPAAITTAIMKMASLTTTTIFIENTNNIITASAQHQEQPRATTSEAGGSKNK